ncbi:hypothetical protein D9M71_823590 [compost metagenome]
MPGGHAQVAIALFPGQLGHATQHCRGQPTEGRRSTERTEAALALWINAQVAARGQRTTPLQYRSITAHRQAQPVNESLRTDVAKQMAHA